MKEVGPVANPKYGVTVPNTVLTIILDHAAKEVEVLNVDGAGRVHLTAGPTDADTAAPVTGADGTEVLPAAIGAVTIIRPSATMKYFKFISAAAVTVSVREV